MIVKETGFPWFDISYPIRWFLILLEQKRQDGIASSSSINPEFLAMTPLHFVYRVGIIRELLTQSFFLL